MQSQPAKPITMQELPDSRRKTAAVAQSLRRQSAAHLGTVRPLCGHEIVCGELDGGRLEVTAADRALSELQQSYRPFVNKPYDLPRDFDTHWLTLFGNSLEL